MSHPKLRLTFLLAQVTSSELPMHDPSHLLFFTAVSKLDFPVLIGTFKPNHLSNHFPLLLAQFAEAATAQRCL